MIMMDGWFWVRGQKHKHEQILPKTTDRIHIRTVRHAVVEPALGLLQLLGQVRGVEVEIRVHGEGVKLSVQHAQDVPRLQQQRVGLGL